MADEIKIQIKDQALFVETSHQVMLIDDNLGIKSGTGKLKSDPEGPSHIREYIFEKSKWSESEAQKWVADHVKRPGIERRSFDAGLIAFSKEENNTIRLRGRAIPYNQLSNNPIQGFSSNVKERILPEAFSKSLKSGKDIVMLWNHELKYIFGRTSRRTLELTEEKDGVHFMNIPPESNWAKDLLPSIRRGDYSNMSFGFTDDVEPDWTLENGEYVRNVREATLKEISLVPFAVYETTSIAARGAEFMIIDGLVLPDPSFQMKKVEAELNHFKEVEEKFNNFKKIWKL